METGKVWKKTRCLVAEKERKKETTQASLTCVHSRKRKVEDGIAALERIGGFKGPLVCVDTTPRLWGKGKQVRAAPLILRRKKIGSDNS